MAERTPSLGGRRAQARPKFSKNFCTKSRAARPNGVNGDLNAISIYEQVAPLADRYKMENKSAASESVLRD
jgi:hypothetical protein